MQRTVNYITNSYYAHPSEPLIPPVWAHAHKIENKNNMISRQQVQDKMPYFSISVAHNSGIMV